MKKKYLITASTRPVENDFWNDDPRDTQIWASNEKEVLKEWMKNQTYFDFCKTAFKRKVKIYRDFNGLSFQIGWRVIGQIEIDFNRIWKKRHVHVWVEIQELINPFQEK